MKADAVNEEDPERDRATPEEEEEEEEEESLFKASLWALTLSDS